jgi:hypothetical protein
VLQQFVQPARALRAIAVAVLFSLLVGTNSTAPRAAIEPVQSAERAMSPLSRLSATSLTKSSTSEPATTVPATTAAPTTAMPPSTAPPPPPAAPVIPSGKGMWIWLPQDVEGGDPAAIVARAQAAGLTHLYVRMGSTVDGFTASDFLDALLPVAHAAGLRIIGWDFPYFDYVQGDVDRALEAIRYTTPTGDRIDGFTADIETAAEQVNLSPEAMFTYGQALRVNVGPSYLLIATVPRPSPARQADYPYAEAADNFDAFAPMVYWINQPPDVEAADTLDYLSQFGKPVLPVGQAYDGGLEGGPPGTPTSDEISAFINAAAAHGAAGVSFWSWQHATDEMWWAISVGPEVGEKPAG